MSRPLLLIGALALSVLAYGAEAVVLRWTPKVGDRAVYNTTLEVDSDATDHVLLTGSYTEETVSVDSTKVVTKTTGKLYAEDPKSDDAVEVPFNPDTTTTRLDGAVMSVEEKGELGGGEAYRIARATSLMRSPVPVAIGGTWTVTQKGGDKNDVPDLKLEYTFVGEEKVGKWDTYKIASKGGEIGEGMATLEATIWVDKATGARIRTKSKFVSKGDGKTGPTTIISDIVRES